MTHSSPGSDSFVPFVSRKVHESESGCPLSIGARGPRVIFLSYLELSAVESRRTLVRTGIHVCFAEKPDFEAARNNLLSAGSILSAQHNQSGHPRSWKGGQQLIPKAHRHPGDRRMNFSGATAMMVTTTFGSLIWISDRLDGVCVEY